MHGERMRHSALACASALRSPGFAHVPSPIVWRLANLRYSLMLESVHQFVKVVPEMPVSVYQPFFAHYPPL